MREQVERYLKPKSSGLVAALIQEFTSEFFAPKSDTTKLEALRSVRHFTTRITHMLLEKHGRELGQCALLPGHGCTLAFLRQAIACRGPKH